MLEQIDKLISELSDKWDLEDPMSAADLAKVEKVVTLPDELRAFYERAGGASIGPVDIFTIDELIDVNKRRPKALAKAAFFGSDGADGFFFIDAGDALHKGTSAVYWFERGTSGLKGARFCAPDLLSFLRAVASGSRPWIGESLGVVEVDQMVKKLQTSTDRWKGQPGAWPAVDAASKRLNVYLGDALEQLLLTADGFVIPGAGVTVRGTSSIDAVPGTTGPEGRPGAIRFASDERGNEYAVMVVGWRGSEGDDVIRIGAGQDPQTAPVIGSLPAVVVAWLDGRTP